MTLKRPRFTKSVKFDLADLEIISGLVTDRVFLNDSDCIRELFKMGYYLFKNSREIVNPEFQSMIKKKLHGEDIVSQLDKLQKDDPHLMKAIASYLGYEIGTVKYQKKFGQ
jgi:hypothetical protein